VDSQSLFPFSHSLLNTGHEIERLAAHVDRNSLEKLTGSILDCKGSIILSGAGTSSIAAQKIVHSLRCMQFPSYFLDPLDALNGAAGSVRNKDLVIVISNGGETRDVNLFARIAGERGAYVYAVTKSKDCELAGIADAVFIVSVEHESDAEDLLATASISCVIAVFDAVGSILQTERHFTKQQFAHIHPEGKVGHMLHND
jgi:D-arabinose 5-phosphate isomerase GutQ